MICCKIVTNFNNKEGNFKGILDALADRGSLLWENNYLFFTDVEGKETTIKKINSILKKNGYPNYYIEIYDKQNQPKETENINNWLNDKLIKINYYTYENQSQELFKNISKGLDILDEHIKQIEQQEQENKKEEE